MSESRLERVELANLARTAMSGFPRLMQIMTGQVPSVHTFGIMSADNPMGKPLPPEQNNKRREEFKRYLKGTAVLGYVQHEGRYGSTERSFFIPNIPRETLLGLGRQFDQESVIFGAVNRTDKKVVFELIYGDAVEATREVVLQVRDNQEDFYSICKGRKFQIPFFDDAYAPEKKLTRTEDEFIGEEANLTHLATIAANAKDTEDGALGKAAGMGSMLHRYHVLKALQALGVYE